MFERVCFIFHDRQRVFKHTYISKSPLSKVFFMFLHKNEACMLERVCFIFHDRQRVFKHTYMLKSYQNDVFLMLLNDM